LALLQPALRAATAGESLLLVQPPVCSAIDAAQGVLADEICRVEPSAGRPKNHDINLMLTAVTGPVEVGGYALKTENYNGAYLTPVVEAKPGDTLKVRLVNRLGAGSGAHGGVDAPNPTNLHTHGLIVSANNRRDVELEQPGDGDNIFASVGRGGSFDYRIPIPSELPATLLDGESGTIPHPTGLYWYHSHLHGISGTQVAGGMSGLLSIGARDVNVVALDPDQTDELRARTDTAYLMLRDLQMRTAVDPGSADRRSPATWERGFDAKWCSDAPAPDPQERDGFCVDPADGEKVWLHLVNGQHFPTIRIRGGRNYLWRVANLSASVTYRLEIVPDTSGGGEPLPFDLLSVDGVVPAEPVAGPAPVAAGQLTSLLLMPAGRADIYLRNDAGTGAERSYVLRTAGLDTGESGDRWPEIRLARVVFEAVGGPAQAISSGLNAPIVEPVPAPAAPALAADAQEAAALPAGCVPDVDPARLEHRRVTFVTGLPNGRMGLGSVVVRPTGTGTFEEVPETRLRRIDFDRYLDPDDHSVMWDGTGSGGNDPKPPRHVCVRLSASGHGQLWELVNNTGELHNFHLHQAKFRLARKDELERFGIDTASLPAAAGPADGDVWHDTLPVLHGVPVFIIVNFDAPEQLGRYVFHCHILEHEDAGMMAPIEVLP
jgi:FtsP/CotA-like multicopper oxidase with cupredoxin domain